MAHHHAVGTVQRHGGDAHIGAPQFLEQLHQGLVLGNWRGQHHAERLLTLHEGADLDQAPWARPVDGADGQFQTGGAEGVQQALLVTDRVLRIGIVVDQPHQEGAAEGQAAGVGIGGEAGLLDHRLDGFAGLAPHQRALIDHPRHGLLGDAGHARHIVDRGPAAARTGMGPRASAG